MSLIKKKYIELCIPLISVHHFECKFCERNWLNATHTETEIGSTEKHQNAKAMPQFEASVDTIHPRIKVNIKNWSGTSKNT